MDNVALTGKESREQCVTNWLQKQEIRSAGWSKGVSMARSGYREPIAIVRSRERLTLDQPRGYGIEFLGR